MIVIKLNNKVTLLFTVLILVFVQVVAYGQSEKLNSKNPEKYFNNEEYIYAKANGNSSNQARDNAKKSLSESILSKVRSSTDFIRNIEGDNVYEKFESQMSISSENTLWKVRFTKEYVKKGIVYVYAYIKIDETEKIGLGMLQKNEANISELLNQPHLNLNLISKISAYKEAIQLARENEEIFSLLGILNSTHFKQKLEFSSHNLKGTLETHRKQITFDLSSITDRKLKSSIQHAIVNLGFYSKSENSLFRILSSIEFKNVDRFDDLKTVKWNFEIEILYKNENFYLFSKKGIKDHYTHEEAKDVVYSKIERILMKDDTFKSKFLLSY